MTIEEEDVFENEYSGDDKYTTIDDEIVDASTLKGNNSLFGSILDRLERTFTRQYSNCDRYKNMTGASCNLVTCQSTSILHLNDFYEKEIMSSEDIDVSPLSGPTSKQRLQGYVDREWHNQQNASQAHKPAR